MFLCKSRREGGEYAKKEAKKLPDDDFHLIFSSEAKLKRAQRCKKRQKPCKGGGFGDFSG